MSENGDLRMFVGGAWVESESGARMLATSPVTGDPIGSVPEGTREDARRAITAAKRRQPRLGRAVGVSTRSSEARRSSRAEAARAAFRPTSTTSRPCSTA